MSYKEIYDDKSELVMERYELIVERVREIPQEHTVPEKMQDYFSKMASFILMTDQVLKMEEAGELEHRDLEECRKLNHQLYEDILPEHYEQSYGNPKYAVEQLGEEFGQVLSFLYAELRALIPYAFEGRRYEFTILCELFVEIYNSFENPSVELKEVEESIKSFYHDYSEIFAEDAVRATVDPSLNFFTKIIMESDFSDLTYLYRFGEYISENEEQIAAFLNEMPKDQVKAMADTYTEGYRIGFAVTGKDLSKKETVNVRYPIGFERMVKEALLNFEAMGLKSTIFRDFFNSFQGKGTSKTGCYSVSCNKQYDYDHKNDKAMYLDKGFVERRLESYREIGRAHV